MKTHCLDFYFARCLSLAIVIGCLACSSTGIALQKESSISKLQEQDSPSVNAEKIQEVVDKACDFLAKSQDEDGAFSKELGPGITGLVVSAMLRNGKTTDDPTVAAGLAYIEKFVRKEDGGIYSEGSKYRNYETCISIMCFANANQDGRFTKTIQNAKEFVKKIQWGMGDAEGGAKITSEKNEFGGAGYGSHNRPDLSNTSFMIDALKASMDESSESDRAALESALKFVSRTQNKYSQHNSTEFAKKAEGDDIGGFYYTPAAGGESKAGETANGGLRSYASMTYAGLKSLLFAGVKKDDARVKAAMDWISKHYDLSSNPGVGQQGLFYYYHVFGKSLNAIGEDFVVDSKGVKHDWRAELFAELKKRQRKDGSWINPESTRWEEGNPDLVTAYSLLALSYCQKKK